MDSDISFVLMPHCFMIDECSQVTHSLFGAFFSIAKYFTYFFRSESIRLCTPLVGLHITGMSTFSCNFFVVYGLTVLRIITAFWQKFAMQRHHLRYKLVGEWNTNVKNLVFILEWSSNCFTFIRFWFVS